MTDTTTADATMRFDLADLTPRERYKLLSSAVVPRPIALVVTLSAAGHHNAAPYSFFNVLSEDPAIVALGLQVNAAGEHKDTATNIARDGEFVVNLVDDALAEQMNICAVDLPPEESEIEAANLSIAPSSMVRPGRIAESPIALECREVQTLKFSPRRNIVMGEVVCVHVREGMVDPETFNIDIERYKPLGRLFASLYSTQSQRFSMPRMSLEEWRERAGKVD
ncbi:flavin reductase family protein [Acuticoccus sediminis]|nr:flavin reductase family protein [Acuticoccus sediminis]